MDEKWKSPNDIKTRKDEKNWNSALAANNIYTPHITGGYYTLTLSLPIQVLYVINVINTQLIVTQHLVLKKN